MLERAALHQTRFRMPGVSPDARGIVLGQKGVVLFSSIDRLVTFLRAYGDEGSLDELLPSLSISRVRTPLRTHEILLSIHAESSYRMDQLAGVAKLAGGLVFTGTSRHFVKYRDASSPLGYDVQQLLDEPADLVLYDQSFQQVYENEREIDFRDLVLKLTPYRDHSSESSLPERLLVTAEVGVGAPLVSYFFRWRVEAKVALAEWPNRSAFDDAPRRLYVFDTRDVSSRIVDLLRSVPGVHVFEPLGENFAVEFGFRHPIALDSCASLFSEPSLFLFRGDGRVELVEPVPPFVPVGSLIKTELHLDSASPVSRGRSDGEGQNESPPLRLALKLAASQEPWRKVVAAVVPVEQREWLSKMLYVLPPRTMGALRVALGEDRIYLLDSEGVEGVPLGTFFCEVAPRIYVPAGLTLVPAVASEVLEELVRERADGHVFFEPGRDTPVVVPGSAFGPLSRRALSHVIPTPVDAERLAEDEPSLPLLTYDDVPRFPLFGLPGKVPDDEEDAS